MVVRNFEFLTGCAMQVDFCQLQVNTLRRYKRHYKLQTRPGLNKSQLVEVGFYENEYNLKTSALFNFLIQTSLGCFLIFNDLKPANSSRTQIWGKYLILYVLVLCSMKL